MIVIRSTRPQLMSRSLRPIDWSLRVYQWARMASASPAAIAGRRCCRGHARSLAVLARGIAFLHFQHDVAGNRRGGRGTAAAMLDNHRAGIPRRMHRRKGHEQRVVALLPGLFLVLAHTGIALGLGDAAHLRSEGHTSELQSL